MTKGYDDTANPICPYCKHEDKDWHDGLDNVGNGSEWTMWCPCCGKDYTVTICVVTSFFTKENNTCG